MKIPWQLRYFFGGALFLYLTLTINLGELSVGIGLFFGHVLQPIQEITGLALVRSSWFGYVETTLAQILLSLLLGFVMLFLGWIKYHYGRSYFLTIFIPFVVFVVGAFTIWAIKF